MNLIHYSNSQSWEIIKFQFWELLPALVVPTQTLNTTLIALVHSTPWTTTAEITNTENIAIAELTTGDAKVSNITTNLCKEVLILTNNQWLQLSSPCRQWWLTQPRTLLETNAIHLSVKDKEMTLENSKCPVTSITNPTMYNSNATLLASASMKQVLREIDGGTLSTTTTSSVNATTSTVEISWALKRMDATPFVESTLKIPTKISKEELQERLRKLSLNC